MDKRKNKSRKDGESILFPVASYKGFDYISAPFRLNRKNLRNVCCFLSTISTTRQCVLKSYGYIVKLFLCQCLS